MKITLNNRSLSLTQSVTLGDLLTQHHHPAGLGTGTALAVNKTIIPRRQWSEYWMQDGDDIIVFHVIAGG